MTFIRHLINIILLCGYLISRGPYVGMNMFSHSDATMDIHYIRALWTCPWISLSTTNLQIHTNMDIPCYVVA